MKSCPRSPLLLAALLSPLAAGSACAATPREELIRLVPGDVGFCLVIGDLRVHHERVLRSPWIKALGESPLGRAIVQAPELAGFGKLDDHLRRRLGVTWPQLRDEILGDAIVLAHRAGPPGKPHDEEGALLLWARNPDLLAKVVERLNQEQQRAGELKEVQARAHRGLKYCRRVEAGGESFYHLGGPVLVFAAREGMLREILDRRADLKRPPDLPLAARLKQAGTDRALATLWINPRALDAELRTRAESLKPEPAHALNTFLTYWKALDGVSLSLTLDRDPEVVLAAHARAADLPAAARRLFAAAGKASDLWGRFPDDAVLTFAACVDVPALFEALGEFLTPDARRAIAAELRARLGVPLSETLTRQLLPALGPDCGLCLVSAGKDRPPHLLVALRIRPGPGAMPAARSLLQQMQLFAVLGVLDHNRKSPDPIYLKKEVQAGVEVHYFAGKKFPHGLRPAFAVKAGYLVLANSPDAIRRFAAVAGPAPQGSNIPLLRVSLQRLAQFLKERRDPILAFLALRNGLARGQAGARLEGLLSVLEWFDHVELTQRTEGDRIDWVVRLKTFVPKR
ncbi:MAG: hypothetical protein IT429_15510 [Gemmataceae bacterium]|nr:hypothetical protein [Gemmataceae bacterium]